MKPAVTWQILSGLLDLATSTKSRCTCFLGVSNMGSSNGWVKGNNDIQETILDLPKLNNFCTLGRLAANDRNRPQLPQIVQIGPIVQKRTWTRWNCKNEADLTYLDMLDGSFCMLTNKVYLLSRRQEKQIYRLVKIGEEYDKTTKALKEGFGATLKAIFVGWETPDRYRL